MQKGIAQELTVRRWPRRMTRWMRWRWRGQYVARKRMKKPEGREGGRAGDAAVDAAGFSTGTVWKVLREWGVEVEEVDRG